MAIFITAQNNIGKTAVLFVRLIFTLVLMVLILPAAAGDAKVALITASGSNIDAISARDLRRLYLGLNSSDSGAVKNPVINLHFVKYSLHL